MMLVYLKVAEAKMDEKRIDFDKMMAESKTIQRSGPINRRLSETMFNLMRQRFKNIDEYLLCHCKLKTYFFDKAPTVMN